MLHFTFKFHASLIHIYIQVAHNCDAFYATNLKFGMIFTQTKSLDLMLGL